MTEKNFRQHNDRPVLNLSRTYMDWFFDAASLGGLLLMVVCLIYYWPFLPETIPTHFGFSGEADGWGNKTTLLILPFAGLFITILLGIAGNFPHTYNYPWKITGKNAQDQYRLAKGLMGWLRVEINILFLYIVWKSIMVSLNRSDGLTALFLPIVLIVIFGTVGTYFFLSARAR